VATGLRTVALMFVGLDVEAACMQNFWRMTHTFLEKCVHPCFGLFSSFI